MKKADRVELGKKFKNLKMNEGLTNKQIADKFNKSRPTVRRYIKEYEKEKENKGKNKEKSKKNKGKSKKNKEKSKKINKNMDDKKKLNNMIDDKNKTYEEKSKKTKSKTEEKGKQLMKGNSGMNININWTYVGIGVGILTVAGIGYVFWKKLNRDKTKISSKKKVDNQRDFNFSDRKDKQNSDDVVNYL